MFRLMLCAGIFSLVVFLEVVDTNAQLYKDTKELVEDATDTWKGHKEMKQHQRDMEEMRRENEKNYRERWGPPPETPSGSASQDDNTGTYDYRGVSR